MFSHVKTKNILKVTKKFKNANCFEVVEDEISEKSLAQTPVVLCAADYKNMMLWVKALQEFKDCLYNDRNHGDRTLMDFNRINTLIKAPKAKAKKAFNPLYYQNSPPVKKKKSKVEYVMQRQLAKIVGLMEKGYINKQKLTRKMNTKLKSAKKIEYDIRSKQNLISKILDRRHHKENQMVQKIRSKVHKKREMQLLKAVKSRIKQYKKKEVKKFNRLAKGRLVEIKSQANTEAKGMMKAIVNQSKLTPYDECINPKLKNFGDKTYLKSHCMNLYGEEKVKQCMNKKEFCPMCCNFHIGAKFGNKRKDCNTKCHNLVFGKKPAKKIAKGKAKKGKKKKGKKGKAKKGKGKKAKGKKK